MSTSYSIIIILLTAFLIQAEAIYNYHVVIDAGGSSTRLQILDFEGNSLLIKKSNQEAKEIIGDSMNLTTLGKDGSTKVLRDLFDLSFGKDQPFRDIIPQCMLTLGAAGMGVQNMKDMIEGILIKFGFTKEQLNLYSDVDLALKLVKISGGVLISGTGSICLTKEGNRNYRAGGLGWLLGDEGSGYKIGLDAIRKSLEQEYEYRAKTDIYNQIKKLFPFEHLRSIIGDLQSGKISQKQIAQLAPLVFELAFNGDNVCLEIIDKAAKELGSITAYALKNLENNYPIIYLIGGVFKSQYANSFIKKISASPHIAQLKKKPIFVNISEVNYAVETVREQLLSSKDPNYLLHSLPFEKGDFKLFSQTYNLEKLITEKSNEKTQNLSQVFQQKNSEAIKLLHNVDSEIIQGMNEFNQKYHQKLSKTFSTCLKKGGRIFFIGSGASGRVAYDLEAKWNTLNSTYDGQVIGLIAGGPRALIKSKEGFEDSEEAGADSLNTFEINQKDVVVLISASASAKFNIGAGNFALNKGASIYYFYNSKAISSYAETFISQPRVTGLLIEIGAMAIRGSTRLQSASVAKLCLGSALNQAGFEVEVGPEDSITSFDSYQNSHRLLPNHFQNIANIVKLELEVFQSPFANFHRTSDENDQGYVTFICNQNATREVIYDCVETSPTFLLNPICSLEQTEQKKAEYRAYMLTDQKTDNQTAWKMFLKRQIQETERKVGDFLINTAAQGNGSYQTRPKGPGNLLIAVLAGEPTTEEVEQLKNELNSAIKNGGKTALIAVLSSQAQPDLKQLAKGCQAFLIVDQIEKDLLDVSSTLILKEVLNLITNSAMIGMGKVLGNMMIDLAPSNNKLIDRSIRIIREIYQMSHAGKWIDKELIYHMVKRVFTYKKLMESQYGVSVPPPINIVLTMLEEKCSLQAAVDRINKKSDDIRCERGVQGDCIKKRQI